MRYTAVFEWPEGQEPGVKASDSWLGGEICAVQFSDAMEELEHLREAAQNYCLFYLRDEIDDPELCYDDKHHAAILAMLEAIGLYTTDPTNDDSLWCEDNRNEEGDPIIPRQGMNTIFGVWNPITSVADRYELCKKLRLTLDFEAKAVAKNERCQYWYHDEDEGRVIVEFAGRVG